MLSHPIELAFLLTYLAVGPLTWVLYVLAMANGRKKLMLMKRSPEPLPGPAPRATILIPAKDEGERIRACIASALAQDYSNFDVITINDRSTDNTGAVMDEMAAANPRLNVIHITDLPAGWTGKNHALWEGVRHAAGEWLLLVDSDVVLAPTALDLAVGVCRRKQFDMFSLLPRVEAHTFWERVLIPVCGGAASMMYLVSLSNTNYVKRLSFANGQFMLMSRRAYNAVGGHAAVRDRYCEDVALARAVKAQGMRPRVGWGYDYAAVRMYDSLSAIIRGWSRIYYGVDHGRMWRVLLAVAFLLVCGLSAWPALGWGLWRVAHPVAGPAGFWGTYWGTIGWSWLAAVAAHVAPMTIAVAEMYRWSGNPRRNTWLFLPITAPMLLYIYLRALRMCVTGKVTWRGTAYARATPGAAPAEGAPSDATPGRDAAVR